MHACTHVHHIPWRVSKPCVASTHFPPLGCTRRQYSGSAHIAHHWVSASHGSTVLTIPLAATWRRVLKVTPPTQDFIFVLMHARALAPFFQHNTSVKPLESAGQGKKFVPTLHKKSETQAACRHLCARRLNSNRTGCTPTKPNQTFSQPSCYYRVHFFLTPRPRDMTVKLRGPSGDSDSNVVVFVQQTFIRNNIEATSKQHAPNPSTASQ